MSQQISIPSTSDDDESTERRTPQLDSDAIIRSLQEDINDVQAELESEKERCAKAEDLVKALTNQVKHLEESAAEAVKTQEKAARRQREASAGRAEAERKLDALTKNHQALLQRVDKLEKLTDVQRRLREHKQQRERIRGAPGVPQLYLKSSAFSDSSAPLVNLSNFTKADQERVHWSLPAERSSNQVQSARKYLYDFDGTQFSQLRYESAMETTRRAVLKKLESASSLVNAAVVPPKDHSYYQRNHPALLKDLLAVVENCIPETTWCSNHYKGHFALKEILFVLTRESATTGSKRDRDNLSVDATIEDSTSSSAVNTTAAHRPTRPKESSATVSPAAAPPASASGPFIEGLKSKQSSWFKSRLDPDLQSVFEDLNGKSKVSRQRLFKYAQRVTPPVSFPLKAMSEFSKPSILYLLLKEEPARVPTIEELVEGS